MLMAGFETLWARIPFSPGARDQSGQRNSTTVIGVTVSTGSATINDILTATFRCSPFVHGRVRHRPDIPCWVADSPDAQWRTLAADVESGRTRLHGRARPDLGKRIKH